MNRSARFPWSHRNEEPQGLTRPLKPCEPPSRLRRFPSVPAFFPGVSRPCLPFSQVFPDSICYNRYRIQRGRPHPGEPVGVRASRCNWLAHHESIARSV